MFIVVLGGGIDLQGNIPSFVYQRLDKALELYNKNPSSKIVLSGKYSFLYRQEKPPATEAEKMAEYLQKKGISKKDIFLEKKSKDTIGNAYYLKKRLFLPRCERRAIIITSSFHLSRVKYIFHKIFGKGYSLNFVGVKEHLAEDEEKKVVDHQKELLLKTKTLLAKMREGEHDFLKGRIYHFKYYHERRANWVKSFVTKGV